MRQAPNNCLHLLTEVGAKVDNDVPLFLAGFCDAVFFRDEFEQFDVLKVVVSVSVVPGYVLNISPLVVPCRVNLIHLPV